MLNLLESENLIFESLRKIRNQSGYDHEMRDIAPMRDLFERTGVPLDKVPTIIVTGSKGKGSTSILASAMLQGLGYKVGLLTSPHFLDIRERMRLNGRKLPDDDFVRIVNELAPHIKAIEATLPADKYLSPTGLFMIIALKYFYEHDVQRLVLEVGRGGRFDDVSLAQNAVSILTPMRDEHLNKLGPTVKEVAWHKTGIIKPNSTVVTAEQNDIVNAVIREEAQKLSTKVVQLEKELHYSAEKLAEGIQRINVELDGLQQTFTLKNPALYLGMNTALAYGGVAALENASFGSQHPGISAAVERYRLPGRCDVISRNPNVIVDGAIHRESAVSFLESISEMVTHPLIFVTALPEDKDRQGVLDTLATVADVTIVTEVSVPYLYFSKDVVTYARQITESVIDEPDVYRAFAHAQELAGTNGTIFVVGTQSLVRDALIHWQQNLDSLDAGTPNPALPPQAREG